MASQWLHLMQPPGSGPNTLSVSQPPTSTPQRWHPPHSCSPFPCWCREILPQRAGASASWAAHHGHPWSKSSRHSPVRQGAGNEPCQPWGAQLSLQTAGEIGLPGSSPSSSPLVVSLAKESSLGWWYALVFTSKCSCLPPGIVGHILTFSRTQRVVWSPSARGFPAVIQLHDCHIWVGLGAG